MLAALLVLPLAGSFGLADELRLSTAFDASTGRYGQAQSTTILFETLTAKYRAHEWSAWVTLPYLETIGPGNVVPAVGAVDGTASAAVAVESGVGDVVLGATRELLNISPTGTTIDAKGKIRFGTASASRGLGTGRNGYYLELDATQPVGASAAVLASFGRRFTGSTPDLPLHDVWYGSVGASYTFTPHWSADLWLDLREPSLPGTGQQEEATLSLGYRPFPGWKLDVYGVKGFASGSPAIGGGIIITRAIAF